MEGQRYILLCRLRADERAAEWVRLKMKWAADCLNLWTEPEHDELLHADVGCASTSCSTIPALAHTYLML